MIIGVFCTGHCNLISFLFNFRSRTGGGGVDGSKKMETIPGRVDTETRGFQRRRFHAIHRPAARAKDKNHRANKRGRCPEEQQTRDNLGEFDQKAGDAAQTGVSRGTDGLEATGQMLLLH